MDKDADREHRKPLFQPVVENKEQYDVSEDHRTGEPKMEILSNIDSTGEEQSPEDFPSTALVQDQRDENQAPDNEDPDQSVDGGTHICALRFRQPAG